MKAIVSVRDVVNEMEALNHENKAFLNKRTGELITLSLEELSQAEDEVNVSDLPPWQQEIIKQSAEVIDSDDHVQLPSAFDIHEYRIMEDFCDAVEDERMRDKLLSSISGRGAFRRFKEMIYALGMEDDWYRFREEAFEKIAVNWLEKNGIAYTAAGKRR